MWVDRVYNLALNGYYDDNYFFRVIDSPTLHIVQFGTGGVPATSAPYNFNGSACSGRAPRGTTGRPTQHNSDQGTPVAASTVWWWWGGAVSPLSSHRLCTRGGIRCPLLLPAAVCAPACFCVCHRVVLQATGWWAGSGAGSCCPSPTPCPLVSLCSATSVVIPAGACRVRAHARVLCLHCNAGGVNAEPTEAVKRSAFAAATLLLCSRRALFAQGPSQGPLPRDFWALALFLFPHPVLPALASPLRQAR